MLAKSHGEKSKKMRKAKKTPTTKGMPTLTEDYNKADDLVSLVYVDICNGVSRSDVLQKLQLGEYGNKPYKPRQSAYYYNAALDRFAVDTDIEMEKLKDVFYSRYETILAECMKRNDLFNARATLDSMAKIFLGMDKQQNNIQINNNKEGVVIRFGFAKNNNDDIDDAEIVETNDN